MPHEWGGELWGVVYPAQTPGLKKCVLSHIA